MAESYTYDPAGNILSKTVDGKTTTFTYDKANQLVTSTTGGVTTSYAYDAAGRLVKEGDKTYTYGWLDKILSVSEKGEQTAAFDYHMDGQIASATQNGKTENFLWDGLALIYRGETGFINEPYVTGGNPLLSSKGEVMFNDMLGSTLGVNNETGFNPVKMTAFGETEDKEAFFTGKPAIGELGYAFLFRNYRADKGKWQTSDPLGYPDGWNNLAYVNNATTVRTDSLGLCSWVRISDGWVRTVPIMEKDAEANTPEGYRYVPCSSTTRVITTTTEAVEYNWTFVLVYCGQTIDVYIPRWPGDKNEDDFHYLFSYNCGKELNNHPGYQLTYLTMSVWLNPVIREFDCGRTEDAGHQTPQSAFGLRYYLSEKISLEGSKACE